MTTTLIQPLQPLNMSCGTHTQCATKQVHIPPDINIQTATYITTPNGNIRVHHAIYDPESGFYDIHLEPIQFVSLEEGQKILAELTKNGWQAHYTYIART